MIQRLRQSELVVVLGLSKRVLIEEVRFVVMVQDTSRYSTDSSWEYL